MRHEFNSNQIGSPCCQQFPDSSPSADHPADARSLLCPPSPKHRINRLTSLTSSDGRGAVTALLRQACRQGCAITRLKCSVALGLP
eukprot:gene11887-biopygen5968